MEQNKKLAILLISFILLGVFIFILQNIQKNEDSNTSDEKKTVQTVKKTERNSLNESSIGIENQNEGIKNNEEKMRSKELSLFISTYHEKFNNLTNYEAYKNIDWGDYLNLGKNMISDIDEILQSYWASEMKTDLERIKNLINIGLKNKDNITAVYIHRILHDLDIEYNGYQQTKFGFSNYDGGGENQLTVSKYIEEHIYLIK